MVMGSPGMGFITPARAPAAASNTSAVQQTRALKRPIFHPVFLRCCKAIRPSLHGPFRRPRLSGKQKLGDSMRKILLVATLLSGVAIPALSADEPKKDA